MKAVDSFGGGNPDVAFDIFINIRDDIARKAVRAAEMFGSPVEDAIDALVNRSNPQGVAPVDQQRIDRYGSSVKSRHFIGSPGSIHKLLKSKFLSRTRNPSPE